MQPLTEETPSLAADHIPQNAQEAEQLISQWNEPGTEIAPGDGQAPPPAPTPQEFELNYRGKIEKYPIDKFRAYAQQGRDYSEKMRLFNEERNGLLKYKTQWETAQKDLSRLKEFDEVNAYIQKDPAWWEYVRSNYQQRLQEQGQRGTSLPPEVTEKINKLEQFVTSEEQRRIDEARAKEDSELDGFIAKYREQHPDLDWQTLDEQGLDLEKRILNHASELGITKPAGFIAAANNLLFDEHIKRAKLGGKEEVGKQIQKQTKLGLGPITDKPTHRLRKVQNVGSKSWDDIGREAQEALGGAS